MTGAPDRLPRIGFLIDGTPGEQPMTALYEYDELGVRLTVPYLESIEDIRGRWWSQGTMFADDPGRTKYTYNPPTELDYFDAYGPVGLIGCRSGKSKRRFGGYAPNAGAGLIHVAFAVESAIEASNYLKINGLRSEIDGLNYWLGVSALRSVIRFARDGARRELTTSTTDVDDLLLNRALNLKAVGRATSTGQQTPVITFRSQVFLETFVKASAEWNTHLDLHFGVRDLLRIASWRPLNFESHQAAATAETMTIDAVQRQPWRDVRTAETSVSSPTWKAADRFLFYYQDVGRVGVGRWLKLRKAYQRGIDPLIRLLDIEKASVDAHVMQLGIAFEAIGYQALIESGRTPNSANGIHVNQRVDFLVAQVGNAISFNAANFGQDFAHSYNSVKHANRAPVPLELKIEHYRQGVQLIRAWIALRLGVGRATIRSRW